MRQLKRPAIQPPTLARIVREYGEAWKRKAAGGPSGEHWNNSDVRGALIAMHGRACAYCEVELRGGDRGDVEHFRPRVHYRWLAYSFDNLLLSCLECNRQVKGREFPLRAGAARAGYAKRRGLHREERLLLDPSSDPTESLIAYDVTQELCPVVPVHGLHPPAAEMTATTIAFFCLNLDPGQKRPREDLVGARVAVMRATGDLLMDLEAGRHENRAKLKQIASVHAPHGSVARAVLNAAGRRDLLPTPAEDLALLIDFLCGKLDLLNPPDKVEPFAMGIWRRKIDELLHAFAGLMADPPAESAPWVAGRLREKGVLDAVMPILDEYTENGLPTARTKPRRQPG